MSQPPSRIVLPHSYRTIDPAVRRELVDHAAADGFPLTGVLHRPAGRDPDTVLLAMHPRADFTRHYLAPQTTAAGYAFMGATTRYLNHDADALHERLVADVGGTIAWLRAQGFSRVVLLGNSGGGSLFAFYLQQAARAPERRTTRTPSGEPVPLDRMTLPPADGLVLLAAHPGEGAFLLDRLDPSVVDETDPLATDPALDMYDARNGYRPMAEGPSSYAADFVAAFRAAQRARCERIDRSARERIASAADAKAKLGAALAAERAVLARRAYQRPYLLIYRTLADPRYLDPTLDPSERPLGSIFSFGRDPIVGNYGEGLARAMTARGWLSTWSGLSSHAALAQTLPEVTVPTLVVAALADMDIYPSECRRAFEESGATDKTYAELPHASHYLHPVGEAGATLAHPQDRVADEIILPWLRRRWPT